MIIDNGVDMIELNVEAFGNKDTLYPTLIWDNESAVLVDVGMPGCWKHIREIMINSGIKPRDLKAIILTHQDLDHIGSIEEAINELGSNITIIAHENDKPYIEGTHPLIKTNPQVMAPMIESLPETLRTEALKLCEHPPKVIVDQTVADGEILPYCGGIRVIHTPGHTEGHISLYHEKTKTLIAADAMMKLNGKLHGPVSQTSLDLPTAQKSLRKFLNYDIENIICYHGGLCEINVNEKLKALIEAI